MKKHFNKKHNGLLLGVIGILILGYFYNYASKILQPTKISKPHEENFLAPGRDWPSEKKVEDYFVENLKMTNEQAKELRQKPGTDGKVMLRLGQTSNLETLLRDLEYFGFVRDKEALRYALEHTVDTHKGRTPGQNIYIRENSVSIYSYYKISEDMSAWEIADELLNHPTYFAFDGYNKLFMLLP